MERRFDTDIKKERMIESIEKSLGVVSKACKDAGVSRESYYKWLREDESFREKIELALENLYDWAESQLLLRMKDGDTKAIIFFLKTKGKKRGYGNTIDITSGGKEFKFIIKGLNDESSEVG